MSQETAQQIKKLVALVKNKKKLGELTEGLSPSEVGNLLSPGTYAFHNQKGKMLIKKFDDVEALLKIAKDVKTISGYLPIKLSDEEAQAFEDIVIMDGGGALISKTLEKVKEFEDKDKIGRVPIELKAAVDAVAKFEATYTGIKTKLGLGTEVSVTFGEKGGFNYTTTLAANAETAASIGITGIKAKAEAKAGAEHTLKCAKIKVGDYGLVFFAKLEAFAQAVAEAQVGVGGIKKGAFAGIGVSGEIGVEVHGVFGHSNLSERMLGAASVGLELKVGVGEEIEATFTTEEEEVDGDSFTVYTISVGAVHLFLGATLSIKASILTEIQDTILETIKTAIVNKVKDILGDEVIKYVKQKFEAAKTAVVGTVEKAANYVLGNLADLVGKNKSYTALHNNLSYHITTVTERLDKLHETKSGSEEDLEEQRKLKEVAIKMKEYLDKNSSMVSDYDTELNNMVKLLGKAEGEEAILKVIEDNADRVDEIETLCNQFADAKIRLGAAIVDLHSSDKGFEEAFRRIQAEIKQGIEEAGYAEGLLRVMLTHLKSLVFTALCDKD